MGKRKSTAVSGEAIKSEPVDFYPDEIDCKMTKVFPFKNETGNQFDLSTKFPKMDPGHEQNSSGGWNDLVHQQIKEPQEGINRNQPDPIKSDFEKLGQIVIQHQKVCKQDNGILKINSNLSLYPLSESVYVICRPVFKNVRKIDFSTHTVAWYDPILFNGRMQFLFKAPQDISTTTSIQQSMPIPCTSQMIPTNCIQQVSAAPNLNENSNLSIKQEITAPGIKNEIPSPGIQHELPSPGIHHEMPSPGIQHEMSSPGIHHEMPSPGIQHEMSSPGIHHEMPSPGIQHEMPSYDIQHQMPSCNIQYQMPSIGIQQQMPSTSIQHQMPSPSIQLQMPSTSIQHQMPSPSILLQMPSPSFQHQMPSTGIQHLMPSPSIQQVSVSPRSAFQVSNNDYFNTHVTSNIQDNNTTSECIVRNDKMSDGKSYRRLFIVGSEVSEIVYNSDVNSNWMKVSAEINNKADLCKSDHVDNVRNRQDELVQISNKVTNPNQFKTLENEANDQNEHVKLLKTNLDQAKKTVSMKAAGINCKVCNKFLKFKEESYMCEHGMQYSYHNVKICGLCGQFFGGSLRNINSFDQHMKRCHPSEKVFNCHICDKALNKHLSNKHSYKHRDDEDVISCDQNNNEIGSFRII